MASLTLTAAEGALLELVGAATFLRSRSLVERGDVVRLNWQPGEGRAFGEITDEDAARSPYSAIATVQSHPDGRPRTLKTSCTCRTAAPCPHGVALVLAGLTRVGTGQAAVDGPNGQLVLEPAGPAPWELALAPLAGADPDAATTVAAQVALQFELVAPGGRGGGATRVPATAAGARLALRPVVPGAAGGWIRAGITWSNLSFSSYGHGRRSELDARQRRLLAEVAALDTETPGYYRYQQKVVHLEGITSRRIWDLLAEARELGLPLVHSDRRSTPVTLHREPAAVTLEVARDGSDLTLDPRLSVEGQAVPLSQALLVGRPAHGLAWLSAEPAGAVGPSRPGDRVLHLAACAGVLDDVLQGVVAGGTITVPERDEGRFLRDFYPVLRRRLALVARHGDVELPQARPPVLVARVVRIAGHRAVLSWHWRYVLGTSERVEPLWPDLAGVRPDVRAGGERDGTRAVPGARERDEAAEAVVLRAVRPAVQDVEGLFTRSPVGWPTAERLAGEVTVQGRSLILLLNTVVPALRGIPDVEVALALDEGLDPAGAPDYRESEEAPTIVFSGSLAEDQHDWFDLAVTVTVQDQNVPFVTLFLALARGDRTLILDSGTYFSLDREEFRQLAALIAEARALADGPSAELGLRVSRFQAGLWEELDRIGLIEGQAAQWQTSVRALTDATGLVEHEPPTGLETVLRPYQLAGFRWLAALYEYRLGGILADDMGLGKTIQALALISHVRASTDGAAGPDPAAPFLVVAPTSVVFNWAAEAARFAPGLRVAAISETTARRGTPLAEVIEGADLVVTSYTLFRLGYDEYAEHPWGGLILDEAQTVKNHQAQGYQCARRLPAPFKLAITGTPMENNLMELWSLLSITAPGLFADPVRFTDYYRTPIEKEGDPRLLAQLRQRVRPLMLRRTKEQVATDLPDKQEQVLELELNPRHRRVYQTYLQRERQKVLGLLDDFSKNRFEIFRSLTLLRQASLDVALVDPAHASIPSTKLDAMMEQIHDLVREGHRTLVFSQFTRFLDAARSRLDAAGIAYSYLDGSTRRRSEVIGRFKTGTAPVFLISLKAGGVGLNLTEADYCILLDPWWNPATEAQAVDRIHRIGQTRKVMVYRLVAKGTIEEKVMALKAAKAALFSSVMDGGAFESAALTASDVRSLLS